MVSCQMGVSRSASCVMAFLMVHRDMTAMEALTTMRRCRDVRPNDGFLRQLIALDTDLRMGAEERMITLASRNELDQLPKPWNFEFFVGDVTEEEVGSPLVYMGQSNPLRLSGFSSLNETPSCSTSLSRSTRNSKHKFKSKHSSYHQESRSRSCDILEETDDELATDHDSRDDLLASCDELDEIEEDIPILEKVKEIITEPEESWRFPIKDVNDFDGVEVPSPCKSFKSNISYGNFSTTSKPELIQPKPDSDLLSLFKVTSAVQWRELSTKVDIDLDNREEENEENVAIDDKNQFQETTSKQLLSLCWQVKPWECRKDTRLFTSLYAAGWGCDCDEVYSGLFIGDKQTVKNIRFLNKIGITHVLNAAEGPWEDYGFVNLTQEYYKDTNIIYQVILRRPLLSITYFVN